ncbi:hypothetical protein [Helicobacter trogontum]|nr:hypothetical protein [Helicobacter trogontum]MDY5184936.1 hypothetical protein [Helicobacter trogontum]
MLNPLESIGNLVSFLESLDSAFAPAANIGVSAEILKNFFFA